MLRDLFGRVRDWALGKPGSVRPSMLTHVAERLSRTTLLRLAALDRNIDTDLDSKIVGLLPDRRLTRKTLLDAIEADTQRDFRRLATLFATIPPDERSTTLPAFELDPRWEIRAGAKLTTPMKDSTHPPPPRLAISARMVLAVEEILLQALCATEFYTDPDIDDPSDSARTLIPIVGVDVAVDRQNTWFDYDWIEQLSDDETLGPLCSMPCGAWRLMQYELLRELSIQWILLHEFSHWAMGHLDFLAKTLPERQQAIALFDPGLGIDQTEGDAFGKAVGDGVAKILGGVNMSYEDARRGMELSAVIRRGIRTPLLG